MSEVKGAIDYGMGIPDLDVLSRYILHLPLPAGITRDEIAAQVRQNAETAQIYQEMRQELRDLIDLTEGWFGYKGAIRAAVRRGSVSADERLQRAWDHHLGEAPEFRRRVQSLETLLRPQTLAFAACCCAFFFVIGRVTLPGGNVTFPSDGTKSYQGAGSPNPAAPWRTSKDMVAWLNNPTDKELPDVISLWEQAQLAQENDHVIRYRLLDLYTRVLKTPREKTGLDLKELAEYERRKASTEEWLRDHPYTPLQP